MRQREQKWGALWRYMPDSYSLPPSRFPAPFATQLSGIAASEKRHEEAAPRVPCQAAQSSSLREEAERVGLVGPFDTLDARLTGGVVPQRARPEEAAEQPTHTVPSFPSRTEVSPFQQTRDPLLAFLEAHEEDAADLLVLWTSLHRSCVYASELSESVVLQVRYFFHSLLHNRAIAAAVEFYHRLMGLGVQLQQSDVLLLLSSLPYEDATTTEAGQLRKAQESAALEKDRRLWAKRRQEFQEAAQFTQAEARAAATKAATARSASVQTKQHDAVRGALEESAPVRPLDGAAATHRVEEKKNEGEVKVKSPAAAVAATETNEGREEEDNLPSTIARRVAFHQQPEWIKRWILYEASMGTLDSLDAQEELLPSTSSIQHGDGRPAFADARTQADDAAWSLDAVTEQEEAAVQSARASRVMELAAIVDHLHLLTLGAMQREPSSATRHSKLFPSPSSSARRGVGVVEKLYWREALRVVRNAFASSLWTLCPSSASSSTSASLLSGSSTTAAPVVLSADIAASLQHMMREAYTWEGALALLRLRLPPTSFNKQQGKWCGELVMTREDFRSGAVLFVALAAAAQPWKTQAAVEEWMHQCMLPLLAENVVSTTAASRSSPADVSAAVTAVRALWLSHLCGVKASRPEEFVVVAEEASLYMPVQGGRHAASAENEAAIETAAGAGPALQLLHADLAVMIADVQTKAEDAVSMFRFNVNESMLARRAAEALAKSIQSGAYRLHTEEEEREETRNEKETVKQGVTQKTVSSASSSSKTPSSTAAATLPPSSSTSSLLSDVQVDTFVLCCAALKEAVWLRFSAGAVQDRASVTAEVIQFLERSLYGRAGLYAIYCELYEGNGPTHTGHARVSGKGAIGPPAAAAVAAATAAARERPFVSLTLAITLLEVAQLFSMAAAQQPQQSRRPGGTLHYRGTPHLLVELARRVVDCVQPSQIKTAPWRWAAEAQVTAFIEATARTLRVVVHELDVHPKNERVMFGAIPDGDLQLLAELARLLLKTSDLATTQEKMRRRGGGSVAVRCPVWQVLTASTSPRVLQSIQLCFRKSASLGKRVRHYLTSREAERLDTLLGTPRGARRAAQRGGMTPTALPQRMRRAGSDLVPRTRATDADFALAMSTRDAVCNAVSHEATTAGLRESLQELAVASTSWKASLQLCQLVTKDVALARGTCDVDFFATVLTKMASDLAARKAAATLLHGGDSRHRGRRGAGMAAASTAVGPPSLWLSAIDVFWSAVDHTTGTLAAPTEHLLADTSDSPSKRRRAHASTSAELQERAVLARLLLPLLQFSRAIDCADAGRQWRRSWVSKYSSAEKQSAVFRRQNILALSTLNDDSALDQCVADYAQLGHDDALLCHVATRHRSWQRALEAMAKVYGTLEEKERLTTRYPLVVAHTMLVLLSRSPKNLSNTAMRLASLQGQEWDAACSALVVRLLLQARRWSLALRHVEAALSQQPALHRIHASMLASAAVGSNVANATDDSRTSCSREGADVCSPSASAAAAPPPRLLVSLTPQEAVPYVTLLTLALQATAIGGDSTNAPRYYDALKLALKSVFEAGDEPRLASPETKNGGVGSANALDTVLEMTSTASAMPDVGAGAVHADESKSCAELRELSARARLLFFRAMTKKMMTPRQTKGNGTDSSRIDEHRGTWMEDNHGDRDDYDDVMRSSEYWNDTEAQAEDDIHRR